jgi:hypothetical protein
MSSLPPSQQLPAGPAGHPSHKKISSPNHQNKEPAKSEERPRQLEKPVIPKMRTF